MVEQYAGSRYRRHVQLSVLIVSEENAVHRVLQDVGLDSKGLGIGLRTQKDLRSDGEVLFPDGVFECFQCDITSQP